MYPWGEDCSAPNHFMIEAEATTCRFELRFQVAVFAAKARNLLHLFRGVVNVGAMDGDGGECAMEGVILWHVGERVYARACRVHIVSCHIV